MLDNPHITQSATRLTAVIHLTIPKDQIRNVMEPGLRELMTTIAAQGIKPTYIERAAFLCGASTTRGGCVVQSTATLMPVKAKTLIQCVRGRHIAREARLP